MNNNNDGSNENTISFTENEVSSGFPRTFYIANTMEIFERLAWYGFFALSSIYMTTPVEQGGVGFTDGQRGALQGIIPFFLYLLPVFTGALADRYGYRKMFLVSFIIMAPSYYLLGQATSFGGFFLAFMMVALGAACFKPVVVGTISHATNDKNRGLGFGVFYTMVNIGGFLGPLVAGYLRAISWDAVFLMSAIWIVINFIPVLFFYREPEQIKRSSARFTQVLAQAQQVLGNGRFALFIFPCIFLLMVAGAQWVSYSLAFGLIVGWLIVNAIWQHFSQPNAAKWYLTKATVSNKPFALYLLLLTGFWAVYNQLFYTMPLFIRDFVDTRDLVEFIAIFGEGAVKFFASVNTELLAEKVHTMLSQGQDATIIAKELVHLKVLVPLTDINQAINQFGLDINLVQAGEVANSWANQYRQINPEYIINLDFTAIVVCQIAVSLICARFKTINVLVAGVIVFAFGCFIAALANSLLAGGVVAVIAVLMMAFGEMITSPKSQEYVAAIAPKNQAALYMGYYFVSMALGFLFAGLLSGWGYGEIAKKMNNPELMWAIFATLGLLTSAGLFWFNRSYLQRNQFQANTSSAINES
ncbi:peptide MFS transporter [Thalassotalea sp. M1531]|uniref:Peptide MFS transporter n=1 Tax=Thalassotalea algicola TaxID=2716224 RepID=A0A7Y0Q9R2_9GAMM|nr:MFS transporter [Thalassotalea algicola]NMP33470.1 peptide MFS transporter [Thalassotalea algicola]